MDDVVGEGSQGSASSEGFDDLGFVERDNFIEVVKGRRAISSGEPSLDGSIDDEKNERALSDSEIGNAVRIETIAKQTRGPSSDALEGDCMAEHMERAAKRDSEWEDVLGSGELMRRIERKGDGERPIDECTVRINVIDHGNGFDSHQDLEFILGFSYVIDAIELITKCMRVGEKCRVKSSPRFAYGEKGLYPNIPSNQYQEYTIELTSSVKVDLTSLAVDELTELLIKLKERGNFFFSRQEYEKAIFVYKRAISTWNRAENNEEEGMKRVVSALHSNLAVCYAKVEEWKNCLESSDSSLGLDAFNGKALFRKGQSLSRLGEMEEAITILSEARKIDPKDSAIEKELELAKRCAGVSRVKEREMYRKMLSGIASEEEEKTRTHNDKKTINRMYIIIFSVGVAIFGTLFYFMVNYQ